MRRLGTIVAVVALACPVVAGAAEPTAEEPRLVRVSGSATLTAAADQAEIDLGVSTQAASAKEAASENAKRADKVLTAVRQVLGAKANVKTISYAVQPRYGEAKPDRSPIVVGYSAENILRVTTSDLARASDVVDKAIASGANDVRGIRFSLENEDAARAEALRQAVAHAKAEAEAIASSLGVKLGHVHSAESTAEPPMRPMMMMGAAMARTADAPPTPIEPGSIEVHANVAVAFELAD
jgi:uncharacterized protein YggE